jgi:hypothetical protein
MRRILSILFTLVLALGPVWASVPADALASGWTGKVDESRLPSCCRRNGTHHCVMGSPTAANTTANGPTTVSATGCCPSWPQTLASTASPLAAIAATHDVLGIVGKHHSSLPSATLAALNDQRTQPKRGPPTSNIL